MGRLIDADELKAVIDGYDYSEEGYADRIDFEFLYEVIDKQPTAYDPGEVVKQLEKQGITMSTEKFPHKYFKAISVKRAIEIVRGGGING